MTPFSTLTAVLACLTLASSELLYDVPDIRSTRMFEDKLNETLNQVIANLSLYDPMTIPKLEFNYESEGFRINFKAEEVVYIGFSDVIADYLKISAFPKPSFGINLRFHKVHIIVPHYSIDALAVFVPFYGQGSMSLFSKAIDLGGSGKASLGSGGLTSVKDLKVKYNITESNLQISGLLNNEPMSQIVSTSTSECFPLFVQTYGERLGDLFGNFVEVLINDILSQGSRGIDVKNLLPRSGSKTVKMGPGSTVTYKYEF